MNDIISLKEIIEITGATVLSGSDSAAYARIGTDSRKSGPGELFFAIQGDYMNGHWFIDEVCRAGSVGALIQPEVIIYELPVLPPNFTVIQVPTSTLEAFHQTAGAYRSRLGMRTVGVTGSNGKTSAKEFAAAVLSRKFRTAKTSGNFNNHIGVPMSLFSATKDHEFGVFEAGMNHAGEIAPLAAMIAPEIAVITNIGVAHIEHLGSRDAIFEEKAQLARVLPPQGILIYDADDDYAAKLGELPAGQKLTVGIAKGDVRAEGMTQSAESVSFKLILPDGSHDVTIKTPGVHMVRNALLGAAVGVAAGIPGAEIAAGLAQAEMPKGRLQVRRLKGTTLLDDSYNANPDSVEAALETLRGMPGGGRRIAVLGEMGELGSQSESGHRLVGKKCAGVDVVVAIGGMAAWIAEEAKSSGVSDVRLIGNLDEATEFVVGLLREGDVVLVKGSRAAGLDALVAALVAKSGS